MTSRFQWCWVLVLLSWACVCPRIVSAQDTSQNQDTDLSNLIVSSQSWKALRGLPGVHVVVESLKDNVKATTLTEEEIQTVAELELRRVGIPVYDSDDEQQKQEIVDKNIPALYINVNTVAGEFPLDGVYAATISIELLEDAIPLRLLDNPTQKNTQTKPEVLIGVATWQQAYTALMGRLVLADSVKEGVKQLVDKFCNDYLKANPKKK